MKHFLTMATLLSAVCVAQSQVRYKIQVLPRLEDTDFYAYQDGASKINEKGHVLCHGLGETPGYGYQVSRSYVWTGSKYLAVPTASPHKDNVARALNDLGDVEVQSAANDGSQTINTRWNYVANVVKLSQQNMSLRAINNFAVTVGNVDAPGDESVAAYYNGSKLTKMGTLGGPSSFARDINDAGLIVGESNISTPQFRKSRAFTYQDGVMSELDLGITDFSNATCVSQNGWIAGHWSPNSSVARDVYIYKDGKKIVYSRKSRTIDEPSGINNSGTAVGSGEDGFDASTGKPINPVGYIYQDGHSMDLAEISDAKEIGIEIWYLNDINNKGQIVGTGFDGLRPVSFIANPVPEPATSAALGAGIAVLLRKRRGNLNQLGSN